LKKNSPVPPALSAKDLTGVRTQVLNVHRIKRIDRHPAESDEGSSHECIANTKNWLNSNGDLQNPHNSQDDWEADNESDTALDNGRDDSKILEVWSVRAELNVPGLIRLI
jgi:hypothetical protein